MRRARLIAFARKAIALGVPLESLNTLQALLKPDLVERVLEAYCADSGEVPSVYTIDLAAMLEGIAKQLVPRDEESIARLANMRAELEQYRAAGLTAKNAELVRKVLTPRVWSRVVELPNRLLLQARACRDAAPVKAAVLAQMACAICLLTVAPVRLANLASARLETNLVRPDGAEGLFWLVYPEHDVKNRVRLEFPLDQQASDLIDEYVNQHQPVLMRGRNELYLWPGEVSGHKGKATLSAQITKCIQKATGLRVTVHQFRHAAAALILQAQPGNYEFVRRILGHKNIKTTIEFYTGLETAQATRIFGQIVRGQVENRAQNWWE
jgi:integrase